MDSQFFNSLRPRHNGCYFIDATFKYLSIGTDNGLEPGRQNAIVWTDAG